MDRYPLVFTYRDLVAGNGFVAGVVVNGRALLTVEDGEYWMEGVTPGGMAGGGTERSEAFRAFKEGYLSVLIDCAVEAANFEDFKREVEGLLTQTSEPARDDWEECHRQVRAGRIESDLPRVIPPELHIRVALIQNATPSENAFEEIKEAA